MSESKRSSLRRGKVADTLDVSTVRAIVSDAVAVCKLFAGACFDGLRTILGYNVLLALVPVMTLFSSHLSPPDCPDYYSIRSTILNKASHCDNPLLATQTHLE